MPVFRCYEFRLLVWVILFFFTALCPGIADQVTLEQAVEKTFKDNPYIQIEKEEVTSARGDFQASLGEFDWLYFMEGYGEHSNPAVADSVQAAQISQREAQNAQIAAMNNLGASLSPVSTSVASTTRDDVASLSTGVSKTLKSGITLVPSAGVIDYSSNSLSKDMSQTDVRLKIVVPVLKGLGREVTMAESQAAAAALEARKLSSYHNISDNIHSTVAAFYNCLGAQQSYGLVNESFERADALLANVKNMVAAGMLEPAFLNQAKAKLYNTQVDVKNGEISLYEARQALGLAMGMDAKALVDPPVPQGDFPGVLPAEVLSSMVAASLVTTAEKNRMDYQAALRTVSAEKILLKQARDDKRPQLDLTFQLGYAGVSEESRRYVESFYDNIYGAYGYAGFSLELPLENNYAKGRFLSQASAVTTAKLTVKGALNLISSEVLTALETVKMLAAQFELGAQSVERYKAAVAFEKKKYDAGESTLNALIDIEDRYIEAKLRVNETKRRYAVALARLRFVTGTLLERQDDELRFHIRKMAGPVAGNR